MKLTKPMRIALRAGLLLALVVACWLRFFDHRHKELALVILIPALVVGFFLSRRDLGWRRSASMATAVLLLFLTNYVSSGWGATLDGIALVCLMLARNRDRSPKWARWTFLGVAIGTAAILALVYLYAQRP
jgi:FtsH-binding integral membrane protein